MKNPDMPTTDICKRLSVSKATLYRYVGPKEETMEEHRSPLCRRLRRS